MRLDATVETVDLLPGEHLVRFSPQAEGGYGVDGGRSPYRGRRSRRSAQPAPATASSPTSRRDARSSGVIDNVRRLHLNAIQFYDWMYRHAQLLPPDGDEFVDALGRPAFARHRTSPRGGAHAGRVASARLRRRLRRRQRGVADWETDGLYRANGQPWTLGEDFLWNVDPTSERWQAHFAGDLRTAVANVGFAGFHLDQYGAPKYALRSDGTRVDLAEAFPALIDRLAGELPELAADLQQRQRLPHLVDRTRPAGSRSTSRSGLPTTGSTTSARWSRRRARTLRSKSVILAAYLSVYAGDEREGALRGAAPSARHRVLARRYGAAARRRRRRSHRGLLRPPCPS